MDLKENINIKDQSSNNDHLGFTNLIESIFHAKSYIHIKRIANSFEKMERPFLEQITHIKNLEQANEDLREKLKAKCDQFNGMTGYVKRLENKVRTLSDNLSHQRLELGKQRDYVKELQYEARNQFETISQLRKELIEGNEPKNIKLELVNAFVSYESLRHKYPFDRYRDYINQELLLIDADGYLVDNIPQANSARYPLKLYKSRRNIPHINPGKGGSNA